MKQILLGIVACILVIAGCATPEKEPEKPVFYPHPPALPRFQFLVSYTGVKDVGGGKSAFDVFVTGTDDTRRLGKPYGVAIYDGKIYVCDTGGALMVFDLNKNSFGRIKGAEGQGKLIQPINISIDRDGNKYVADPLRRQVVVFDRNDEYVRALGIEGNWKPVGAVVYEDRIYVADPDNNEIKVFDKTSGKLIKKFGSDKLDMPTNLAFDDEGYLYISDAARFQVVQYDRDGHELKKFGEIGVDYGHLARPKGVTVDRSGRLYVVDASFYKVQVFDTKSGQLLTFFGEGGTKPGSMILPAQVVIDYDNMKYFEKYVAPNFEMEYLILVSSQFADRMVSVFAFGKEKGKKYQTDEELLKEIKERIEKEAEKASQKGKEGEQPEGEGTKKE